jgi:hypothetical protein
MSNKITASAVCMFTMEQIMSSFHGAYLNQAASGVPSPRPSSCPNKLTYQHLVFSRKKLTMEQEVVSEAIVAETASTCRFNSIDVDFKAKNPTNGTNAAESDVLFVGTGKTLIQVPNS